MQRAFFFRDTSNLNELIYKTKLKQKHSRNLQNYVVIDRIYLTTYQHENFCNNFRCNYSFLLEYIESARVINGIWNCVLVSSASDLEILVMNNGYSYPIFTALECSKTV